MSKLRTEISDKVQGGAVGQSTIIHSHLGGRGERDRHWSIRNQVSNRLSEYPWTRVVGPFHRGLYNEQAH